MKRIIPLSLIALSFVNAHATELESIKVESTYITEVAKKAQKSADLADALNNQVPSIDMNRRSGISNDIILRGQKRDNISIEVDGTKVCGACPNRMDPPVSHVLASQIEDIEVIEGPYDVETFGTMSGGLKIKTKAPKKGFNSEVNLGAGSFGYYKAGATVSGGNDFIRALASVSYETSDQYKDGDGNTMAEQMELSSLPTKNLYHESTKDMAAYKKQSAMLKLFINPLENHELRLSATANRSDDVLYPNTAMDAIADDSNIYSIEYNIDDLSDVYQNLNLQYYYSEVDHPMSTIYRNQAEGVGTPMNMAMSMTNDMDSSMQGIKLKNTFMLGSHEILFGLDASERMWDGFYVNDISGAVGKASIDNSITKNMAAFAQLKKYIAGFDITMGMRFDSTEITVDDAAFQDNDYTGINANIVAKYNFSEKSNIFFGFGQAQRVPDARELYFTKYDSSTTPPTKIEIGTDDLEQTTNRQLDIGYEVKTQEMSFKIKTFYSMLSDYIYYQDLANPTGGNNRFKNIDATIYGAELNANYFPMDELELSASASYKKGQKDEALTGQTDKDLADIAPLRTKLAAVYEYMADSTATLEVQRSEKWSTYDADNGEQELDAWNILNLKVDHTFNDMVNLTVGVNNVLDETYAMSNTYKDITLIANTIDSEVVLLNEPGRYIYTNLNLKF
jgi:iron complex outermembrane receptor protein